MHVTFGLWHLLFDLCQLSEGQPMQIMAKDQAVSC
jgi:hypothetical protein